MPLKMALWRTPNFFQISNFFGKNVISLFMPQISNQTRRPPQSPQAPAAPEPRPGGERLAKPSASWGGKVFLGENISGKHWDIVLGICFDYIFIEQFVLVFFGRWFLRFV